MSKKKWIFSAITGLSILTILLVFIWKKESNSKRTEWKIVAGMQAPHFTTSDINGQTISLNDFQGKYVLLDFWFTSCKPCQKDTPQLKELRERFSEDVLVIIGISVDREKELVQAYVKEQGLDWIQIVDEIDNQKMINKLYHVPYYPTYFLIDPKGIVVDHLWDPIEVVDILEKYKPQS